jgi:hypothetical protein
VQSLPANLRMTVLELRIGPDQIFLEGQARGLVDVQTIHKGLIGGGFAISPPSTETIDNVVRWTLSGAVGEDAPSPAEKGGRP